MRYWNYKILPMFDQIRVLPDKSVIVADNIRGNLIFFFFQLFFNAINAAFAFKVSKIVSIIIKSTPESTNALIEIS